MAYPTNPVYKLRNTTLNDGTLSDILYTDPSGQEWGIPKVNGNTMYAEYLEWAKTNTAEAAD